MKKERLEWIDGIKALACIFVFLNHCFNAFYPAYYFEGEQVTHLNGWDRWFGASAFNVPLLGEVYVALFCLVSAVFMCIKIMGLEDVKNKISGIIVGRYCRLMLPVFPIGVFVYVMCRFGWFTNTAASVITGSEWMAECYNRPIGLFEMLSSVTIKMWFYGDDIISTAFWMLSQMFIGSMIAILLGMLYWRMKKLAPVVYFLVFLALIPRHDYVCVFAAGAIFAWMYKEGKIDFINRIDKSGILNNAVGFVAVVLGIILGGFPEYRNPFGIYVFMDCGNNYIWKISGSILILFGAWNCTPIRKFLSLKPLKRLGYVSYDFYILHIPILFSVGTGIFLMLFGMGVEYNMASLVSVAVSFAVVVILSLLYNRYIEKWCSEVCLWVLKILSR